MDSFDGKYLAMSAKRIPVHPKICSLITEAIMTDRRKKPCYTIYKSEWLVCSFRISQTHIENILVTLEIDLVDISGNTRVVISKRDNAEYCNPIKVDLQYKVDIQNGCLVEHILRSSFICSFDSLSFIFEIYKENGAFHSRNISIPIWGLNPSSFKNMCNGRNNDQEYVFIIDKSESIISIYEFGLNNSLNIISTYFPCRILSACEISGFYIANLH